MREFQTVAFFLFSSLALVFGASTTHAEEFKCADVRPSSSLQPAYRRAAGRELCEGFYDRNISQPVAEIVSVLLQPPNEMQWSQDTSLTIGTPLTPKLPKQLRIQPLRIASLYRIDARFSAPLKLDFKPLRSSLDLELKDLGMTAALKSERSTEMVFAPISISSENLAATTAFITVRVSELAPAIRFRAWPYGETEPSNPKWNDAIQRPKYPWTWATFRVPLIDGKSTRVDVVVSGEASEQLSSLHMIIAGSDYEPR